jgi:mannosyl-3-phosphoglycerate synthase
MRIEGTGPIEHFGSVKVHGVRRMLELDSGLATTTTARGKPETKKISLEDIRNTEQRMAIILPCMNEDLKVFEGVLAGVPHDCLMIVVSNSSREDIDMFKYEQDILSRFCHYTEREAIIIHQKDPFIACAFQEADYCEILDNEGLIRNGKSEGMILGIAMAMLSDREYVGFIDTDNYIPGAVLEYVKHYAFGFNLLSSPYSMIRIQWRYKPKTSGELYFRRWGRVSEVTNRYLNHCISRRRDFQTEIIKTANSGEHAMSLELAKRLTYASGYGVETQELISILEKYGGILPIEDSDVAEKGIEILQTETINPHMHREKGEDHLLREMLLPSLSVIYHSPLSEAKTKNLIEEELFEQDCLKKGEAVPQVPLMPPPSKMDLDRFRDVLDKHLPRYSVPSGVIPSSNLRNFALPSKPESPVKIVFTDLDGTLLHPETYSYIAALDSLRLLQEKNIPLVFCSAKTRSEQLALRDELDVKDPFITENGGAIFIPQGYFRFPFAYDREYEDYHIIELGLSTKEVKLRLKEVEEKTGVKIPGFTEMTTEEIALATGLSLKAAEKAKQREYSETLVLEGDDCQKNRILQAVKQAGLDYIFGGKFYEVSIGNDKGKAVKILVELYKLNFGEVFTIGIGDSKNDYPMLLAVDDPYLVLGIDGNWTDMQIESLTKVGYIGPEGWSHVVRQLL